MWRAAALGLALIAVGEARAYSVLTHQAVIDSVWKDSLEPAIRARFPRSSAEELRRAKAYTYGGCIVHDMGYYPFGSKFFSDLTHYVRSGDFVQRMLQDAADPTEYAFALGALAHYVSDTRGHPIAINRAVAVEYPKLAARYGAVITYAQSPRAHMKTEFGFDVLQVARGRYAPQAYHDFIGFEVAQKLLERSFAAVYSIQLKEVFASVDLAIGSYRWAVRDVIPQATKVAWSLKEDELIRESPGLTRSRFVYNLSRADYEREWGRGYSRPGIGSRILAFLLSIVPKIGPFRAVQFKPPTPQTAVLFMNSFNRTVTTLESLVAQARAGTLRLQNADLDTGGATAPGEYRLADETYAKLARRLAGQDSAAGPAIRADVLRFFENPDSPNSVRANRKEWRKTLAAISKLRASQP